MEAKRRHSIWCLMEMEDLFKFKAHVLSTSPKIRLVPSRLELKIIHLFQSPTNMNLKGKKKTYSVLRLV